MSVKARLLTVMILVNLAILGAGLFYIIKTKALEWE